MQILNYLFDFQYMLAIAYNHCDLKYLFKGNDTCAYLVLFIFFIFCLKVRI